MITGVNESKTLTKHISCKCEYKFDNRKCKSNQRRNENLKKNRVCVKNIIFGILLHVVVKMVSVQKVLSMIQ